MPGYHLMMPLEPLINVGLAR